MRTKRITHRILIAMLMVALLAGLSLLAAAAEPVVVASGECGENLTWTLDDQGLLIISGTGPMSEYEYPEKAPWLAEHSADIKTVVIESGVTSIGDHAFYDCGLLSVTIGNDVTVIGSSAFEDCSSLESINLPDGVTTIGSDAFSRCVSLTSITIPDSVTSIGGSAFYCCESLETLVIGNGLVCIDGPVFGGCKSLKSVTLGNSIESIGSAAFIQCSSLESITIPDSVTSIGSGAFNGCTSLKEIRFLGDAPAIGTSAFRNVTATAYYPANNDTWTEDVRQDYGGTITWVAERAKYTVTFQYEDGTIIETKTYHWGDTVTPPADPTAPEGYVFKGWTPEITVCQGDAVYTAVFVKAYICGDVNGDGTISPLDGLLLIQCYVGMVDVETLNFAACDCNGDGTLNPLDAMLIVQYYIGMIDKFPVE